jgi:hypothetical protein
MNVEARTRRLVGLGCRIGAVAILLAVVTVLTGSTFDVGVALVLGSLLVTVAGSRRT